MTHCGDPWERLFRHHPEACEMCDDYRRKLEKHLTCLDLIRSRGITVTSKTFPEGAFRELPSKEDPHYETALNYVCHCLKRGERISSSDLKKSLKVWRGEPDDEKEEDNTNVLSCCHKPPVDSLTNVKPADPVTPVMLGDRLKDEPHGTEAFQTAAEIKAKVDCGIAGEMFSKPSTNPSDPTLDTRQRRIQLADQLLECYSERVQMNVMDLIRNNDKGMKTAADVFYFGVESLIENRKGGRR